MLMPTSADLLILFGFVIALITWAILDYIDKRIQRIDQNKVEIIYYDVEATPERIKKVICKSMDLRCRGCQHCLFHEETQDCGIKKCKRGKVTQCR